MTASTLPRPELTTEMSSKISPSLASQPGIPSFELLPRLYAEILSVLNEAHIGVNALDYRPDCRPDYIQAMQKSSDWETKQGRMTGDYHCGTLINLKKTGNYPVKQPPGVPGEQPGLAIAVMILCCGVCDSSHD